MTWFPSRAEVRRLPGLACRLLVWLCLVGATVAPAALARAQGAVVVLEFDGPRSGKARSAALNVVRDNHRELMERRRADAAAQELGVSLQTAAGRQAVAAELQIAAFVSGEVTKRKKRFSLTVTVFSGEDGRSVGDIAVGARRSKFNKRVKRAVGRKLGRLLDQTRVPPPPAVEQAAEQDVADLDPEDATDSDDGEVASVEAEFDTEGDTGEGPGSERGELVVIGLHVGLMARNFTYKDSVIALSDHSLGTNLAPALSARIYPLTLVTDGFISNVGLEVFYRHLLLAKSKRGDAEFDTRSSDLRLGLHGRLPLGANALGLGVGYGSQSTSFADADDGTSANVPHLALGHVRLAADAVVVLGPITVEPSVALLLPLSYGDIGGDEWFPHVAGNGFEVGLQAGLPLAGGFELALGGSFRQWGLAFNPEPDDPSVVAGNRAAGGATDRYTTVDLIVRYRN